MARPAWKALEKCCQELQKLHLRDFLAGEGSDFVNQGVIWQANRFDPWGGELGKVLAQLTIPGVESVAEPPAGYDGSTNRLMGRYRRLKEAS